MDTDAKKHKITLVYNYSPDELRLLRQCSFEAFIYRALPLSMLLGIGTAYCLRHSTVNKLKIKIYIKTFYIF